MGCSINNTHSLVMRLQTTGFARQMMRKDVPNHYASPLSRIIDWTLNENSSIYVPEETENRNKVEITHELSILLDWKTAQITNPTPYLLFSFANSPLETIGTKLDLFSIAATRTLACCRTTNKYCLHPTSIK
ncbi:hypothetical protein BLNAU_20574 [Blattamonas nauphoetae]|uniref:Uncharacterized protein n=1 Tax=Blattamonas nauphoetae TaxID=2049346 RepID=A0ABQ9WYC7_9EUKA|nr:hypothetical protein BLNAU_20574 [Blattamonas nauphoetae]